MKTSLSLSEINHAYENGRASREFIEVGRWLALAKGKNLDAAIYAKQANASARVLAVLEKAGPGVNSPGSGEWGLDAQTLSLGFVQSLSHSGVFDSALASMVRLPLQCRISLVVGRAQGTFIDQGEVKQVSEIELEAPTLSEQKTVTIVVVSEELLRLTTADGLRLLETELRSSTAGASDAVFIAALIAATSPTGASNDPLTDMATLSEATVTGDRSRLFLVVSSLNCKRLAFARTSTGAQTFPAMTPQGGTISGVQVLVSDEISNTEVVMFDAQSIAANGGRVDINGSGDALVDMGGSMLSTFQRNLRAMICHRVWGFEILRASGVASLSGVDWTVVGAS